MLPYEADINIVKDLFPVLSIRVGVFYFEHFNIGSPNADSAKDSTSRISFEKNALQQIVDTMSKFSYFGWRIALKPPHVLVSSPASHSHAPKSIFEPYDALAASLSELEKRLKS